MEKKYISELHQEHLEWSKQLEFAKDEIKSFKNRLSDVVSSNSKTEILAEVEMYQNQFIRQEEVIDILLHDINAAEHLVVENAKQNTVATDHRKLDENVSLVNQMKSFSKLFDEMKGNFNRFLSKSL